MKKKLFKIAAVSAVLVTSVATSTAYFTDSADSVDNVVTTGTFVLQLQDNNQTAETVNVSLTATGLMPVTDTDLDGRVFDEGALATNNLRRAGYIRVYNPNSVPLAYEISDASRESGNVNIYDWLHVRVGTSNYVIDGGTNETTDLYLDNLTLGSLAGGTPFETVAPGAYGSWLYFELMLENAPVLQPQNATVEFTVTFTARSA